MDMPLVEAMRSWVARGGERWHTPGHKGKVQWPEGIDLPWAFDLTEVGPLVRDGGPDDKVRASEDRLACQLGVRRTWYSVQGASLPVMAALLSAFPAGSTVAVERHAHRSVLAAMILGDIRPQWLATQTSLEGLVVPASEAEWEMAMNGADGLVLSRPTYDGVGLPGPALGRLIARAHSLGQTVVVDEAHGAHWPQRLGYPESALYLGADLVAHGVHKTEATLTQTGALHLVGEAVDPNTVDWWWSVLATSSPSYLLLASLDRWQAQRGTAAAVRSWEALAQAVRRLWCELSERGFQVWQVHVEGALGLSADPAKLTLLGPGPAWARDLAKVGQVEKVEEGFVTFILGPEQSRSRLGLALDRIAPVPSMVPTIGSGRALPRAVLHPREAVFRPMHWVPVGQAAGRIAARAIVPYPPGTPWLVPGEEVSAALLQEIVRSRGQVARNWEGCRTVEGELWIGVIAE